MFFFLIKADILEKTVQSILLFTLSKKSANLEIRGFKVKTEIPEGSTAVDFWCTTLWIFMDFHGFLEILPIFIDVRGCQWISVDVHGFPWMSVDFCGCP